ncbi:hypothetical protein U1872_03655 [Sphingomonas sp. RB3P16]|uniref:SctD/MshK family protein n=1 Tax=Parasphingomonas frigoris TaxID=3096163 RepID=UPI002FC9A172
MSDTSDPVLRILNGRLTGTSKTLPAEGTISIGYQFWQDVVIRDPATKGIAIDLVIAATGVQITILSGEAALLGSTLAAGQTAPLPAYIPFSIGGVAIAWGEAESPRWGEASDLANAVPSLPAPAESSRDQAMALVERVGDRLGDTFHGWRLGAIAAVAALLLVAGALGPGTLVALGLRSDPATRVDRALARVGLPQLRTSNDSATGGVLVRGVVGAETDRTKAQDVLADLRTGGSVDVQTAQDLATATADIARIHGVKATARPLGLSDIELHTTQLTRDQRVKLISAVRSDVPAVQKIRLQDDLIPDDEAPLRTVADATKTVSTVVAGDPAYIQTNDGARYFPGAMMPSGHRLVGIQAQTVLLEKNGRQTRLSF